MYLEFRVAYVPIFRGIQTTYQKRILAVYIKFPKRNFLPLGFLYLISSLNFEVSKVWNGMLLWIGLKLNFYLIYLQRTKISEIFSIWWQNCRDWRQTCKLTCRRSQLYFLIRRPIGNTWEQKKFFNQNIKYVSYNTILRDFSLILQFIISNSGKVPFPWIDSTFLT